MTIQSLLYLFDKTNRLADVIHGSKYGIFIPEIGWVHSSKEFYSTVISAYAPEAAASILISTINGKNFEADEEMTDEYEQLKNAAAFELVYSVENNDYRFEFFVAQFE